MCAKELSKTSGAANRKRDRQVVVTGIGRGECDTASDVKEAFEAHVGEIDGLYMGDNTALITFKKAKHAIVAKEEFDQGELNGSKISVTRVEKNSFI